MQRKDSAVRVVDSKAMPGLPSAVASPDLGRMAAYGTVGLCARCLDLSKKCSARASSDARDGKERTSACTGIVLALASCQYKEGYEGRDGSGVVE